MRFEAQVLVLDSLHDLFGGNENARPQARQFIQALRQIAMEIDGAVILTAHPSLSGRNTGTGEAGSTAWNNAVRSRLYLKEAEDCGDGAERILKTMKSNYGPKDGEIRLLWKEGTYQEIIEDPGMIGSIKRAKITAPSISMAFGLFCEDDEDELHRRVASICKLYDTDPGALENLALCSRVGLDNTLMDFPSQWEPGEPTGLYGEILDHCMRFEAQVLVLDSLHDLFGGNENARPQARQFIQALRQIAMEIDGAVILTAHPSLSGRNTGTGEAGSTAWNNAVRSRLYLKEAEDCGDGAERILKTMKSNYGPKDGEIRLLWKEGTYQEIIEDPGMIGSIKRAKIEKVFMECLRAVAREGRTVSESNHSGNYAPKLFINRPEGKGYRREDFRRAMEALFHAGKIRNQGYGRGGDTRQRIVAAQPETQGEDQ